jgi:hypothetical protein
MALQIPLRLIAFVVVLPATINDSQATQPASAPQTITCDVTAPNGTVADGGDADRNSYGNRQISVGPFGLWPDGTVVFKPGGPGFITPDGALGMKFGWQRGVRGQLKIEGRRIDAPAPALRSEVNNGYGDIGFHASYVIFPAPGCWEVTGRVADASVTFVTRVVKIGEGPAWRRDAR